MFRYVIGFLRLTAFLDEEELALSHGVSAEEFCCPFPRLRARLQTIEKLAKVEIIQFDAIGECHNWQYYLARYANGGKHFLASLGTVHLALFSHGSRKTMDTR